MPASRSVAEVSRKSPSPRFGIEVGDADRVAGAGVEPLGRPGVEHDLIVAQGRQRFAAGVEKRSQRRRGGEIQRGDRRVGDCPRADGDPVGQVNQHRLSGNRLVAEAVEDRSLRRRR